MSRSFLMALITVPIIVGIGLAMGWVSNSGYGNPWFVALTKPAAMPPGWVFGAAWSTLYMMLGIALALVLGANDAPRRRSAFILFVGQLALNYSWSPLFFRLHAIEAAFAVIIVMFGLSYAAALMFGRISRAAGLLMLPYLAWLCFAAYLNFEIIRLNPAA